MQINSVELKNFRCFPSYELNFQAPLVLISGANGSGKTSLLEALHYACYLRSFRTHVPKDLLSFGRESFFLKVGVAADNLDHELQVGFSSRKKLVKIDQQPIKSYKELIDYYRTITLTEDDLLLIKGGPEERRLFIDQAVMLHRPEFLQELRTLRSIVAQRNALVSRTDGAADESYWLWTQQLFEHSQEIARIRAALLSSIEVRVNQLLRHFKVESGIALSYKSKYETLGNSWNDWVATQEKLPFKEFAMGRTLFGAHLDEIDIKFKGQVAKSFSSRGQQKLILMLLKIAQLQELKATKGPALLLLDDFMNDFDEPTAFQLIELIKENAQQAIFTSPLVIGHFEAALMGQGCHKISL